MRTYRQAPHQTPVTHRLHMRRRIVALFSVLSILGALLPGAPPLPATAAEAADITLVPMVDGLQEPLGIVGWPGDASRLLVLERAGNVRLVENGNLVRTPWLNIQERVTSSEGEQGLLALALHPDFPGTPYIWVLYTGTNGANTVSRFTVDANGAPDPASELVLFAIEDRAPNHNGGWLAFGPDGYLYISTGDEGGGGDPYENAQDLTSLYGKMLRLDVDDTGAAPYVAPPDNLHATNPNAAPEIWAYGLRNPWRFSFDRETGDLWIADVGQEHWEEINRVPVGSPAGLNFGWPIAEGMHCFGEQACNLDDFVMPVMEYWHVEGCSVTGGYRYRGSAYPDAVGAYLFGDFCGGGLWMARQVGTQWQRGNMLETGRSIVGFGEDAAGELYLTDISNGTIYRLAFGGGAAIAGAERTRTWERTDAPVASGAVSRTWIWGPAPVTTAVTEAYADSPGGVRSVQYFDKARMEITHPDGDPNSIWYITNGLLVVELMTGRMQVGDDAFIDAAPARVPVAGDLNDASGLTYATLANLRDASPSEPGTPLDWRIDFEGNLSHDPSLAAFGAVAAERVTVPGIDHTIANVFWNFMNSSGLVNVDGSLVTDRLFVDPFYATGLPLTEAYWTTARVAGTERNVLVQCFERRCLTWTPDNPDGWQVEAANVGLHYLAWRNAQETPQPAAQPAAFVNATRGY